MLRKHEMADDEVSRCQDQVNEAAKARIAARRPEEAQKLAEDMQGGSDWSEGRLS